MNRLEKTGKTRADTFGLEESTTNVSVERKNEVSERGLARSIL